MPDLLVDEDDQEFRDFIFLLYAGSSRLSVMRRQFAKLLDLSSAEFAILMAISYLDEGEGTTIKSIADHMHVAATSVTAKAITLEESGWISKSPNPNDNRAVLVRLTAESKQRLTEFAPILCDVNDRWFSGVSRAEFLIAKTFLERFVEQYDAAMVKMKELQISYKNKHK